MRGRGTFELQMRAGPGIVYDETISVDADEWTWVRVPVPGEHLNAQQSAGVRAIEGVLDLDEAILTRAGWVPPVPGEALSVPAVCFFRAGYTTDDFGGVRFRVRYDRDADIFYARNLYLEPGTYRVRMDVEADAPAGTKLGEMVARMGRAGSPESRAAVVAGAPAEVEYVQPDNRFFYFGFEYARTADLLVRAVSFERLR